MATCREPSCTDGFVHEDGDVSPCMLCVRRQVIESFAIDVISGLDGLLDGLADDPDAAFPNRATRKASRGRRHARAAWLWERHDERRMAWALASGDE